MSAGTRPMSPTSFASALGDLPLPTLHLKVLEMRNSIAHLRYSNDQLRPFAVGTSAVLGGTEAEATHPQPDQDCIDAIKENELVMDRMAQRIALVRAEVEQRAMSWTEFQSKQEVGAQAEAQAEAQTERAQAQTETESRQVNGHASGEGQPGENLLHSAWTDGTFQTGTIRNGEIRVNGPSRAAAPHTSTGRSGGRLTDDEPRRAMEERVQRLGQDEEGGMHL